jgi:DNA-binding Lrp family transcriptional regulator
LLRVTEPTTGVSAYILVQTEIGKASGVRKAIQEIEGVTAEVVSGPYDVIVRATAPTVDDLSRDVVARVQGITGITRTLLCVVVNI